MEKVWYFAILGGRGVFSKKNPLPLFLLQAEQLKPFEGGCGLPEDRKKKYQLLIIGAITNACAKISNKD